MRSSSLFADNISVTGNASHVSAWEHEQNDSDYYFGTAINGGATTIEAATGTSRSTVVIDWKNVGNATILDFVFHQERAGGQYYGVGAGNWGVDFTANANSRYSLSGRYAVDDIGATSASRVGLQASLTDNTSRTYLFDTLQSSDTTSDETFTWGNSDGDSNNDVSGTLEGDLVAGRNYTLRFNAFHSSSQHGDSGATATGFVNLTITAVPAPSSFAALIGMGAMGLIAAARRRRKQA